MLKCGGYQNDMDMNVFMNENGINGRFDVIVSWQNELNCFIVDSNGTIYGIGNFDDFRKIMNIQQHGNEKIVTKLVRNPQIPMCE